MTLNRMDNVLIVVDDLEAAIAFFTELGLELEGETAVEGQWVDRIVGLEGVRSDIAMMRTPDGHGRIELDKFHTPKAVRAEPEDAPVTRWAYVASCSPSTTSRKSWRDCAPMELSS
jgi:catechol 2,3-dioxygenase-like lactoylglutathione lyase family enzyme